MTEVKDTDLKTYKKENHHQWALFLTWMARVVVGVTFIFSGFTKSVDPWGTLYKIQDYLAAMGLDVWTNLLIVGAFMLCAGEFALGGMLLFGCYRKATPILLTAVMAVMLPLTLWIAIADPVADCGCFGDALIISNWGTFWKNVVLSLLSIWLLKYNEKARCLITPYMQWLGITATGIFIVIVEFFGYSIQPLIDFRPYKVGGPIVELTENDDNDEEFVFVYEKEGKRQDFSIDNLPDESEGWVFVDRKALKQETSGKNNRSQQNAHSLNFRIWSEDGEEDITAEVAAPEGKRLFLMMPELAQVSIATTWQINSLYTWANQNNIDMIAVVNGNEKEIEQWRDLSLASYPIYTADDTQIKEVVRGNPAVVYTDNGKIVWKSSLRALNTDDFLAPGTSADPKSFLRDDNKILRDITIGYIIILAALVFLSFTPSVARLLFHKKTDTTHDGKAHHVE